MDTHADGTESSDKEQDEQRSALCLVSDDDSNKVAKEKLAADQKKLKRVMANRRSARESRERRKKLLSNLETSVDILSKENANLMRENNELRQQLASLLPQAHGSFPLQGLGLSQDLHSLQASLGAAPVGMSAPLQTQQLLQLQKDQLLEAALRRRTNPSSFF